MRDIPPRTKWYRTGHAPPKGDVFPARLELVNGSVTFFGGLERYTDLANRYQLYERHVTSRGREFWYRLGLQV